MKLVLSIIVILASSFALADQINLEVDVPETAKTIVFTAKNVTVDSCNHVSLQALSGWGAASGKYSLAVLSGTKGCEDPATKEVTLTSETEVDDWFGQPKTIKVQFYSSSISNLKVSFK